MNRCGPGTRCGFDSMTGLNLGGFIVPGGNGLPDLFVHANDPTGWVQMQIAARQNAQSSAKDVATTATVGTASTVAPDWVDRLVDAVVKRVPNPKDYFKGAAIAALLVVLALVLVTLGGYQLFKE